MYIFPALVYVSTILLLPTTTAAPVALVVPFSDPSIPFHDPSVPDHCRKMEADMSACFGDGTTFLGDLELDQDAIKSCVCSKDNITAEIVTSCTGDHNAWSDICGDDLKVQEAVFGFSVSY